MEKATEKVTPPEICYAGLALLMFLLIFPCLMVTMFLMEAPEHHMAIIQAFYTVVVFFYVVHVLLDLTILSIGKPLAVFRNVVGILCPILGSLLALPVAGMLMHARDQGGFNSSNANAALAFSILVVFLELLHLIVTANLYLVHYQKIICFCCNTPWCFPCFIDKRTADLVSLPSATHDNGFRRSSSVSLAWQDEDASAQSRTSYPGVALNNRSEANSASTNERNIRINPPTTLVNPSYSEMASKLLEPLPTAKTTDISADHASRPARWLESFDSDQVNSKVAYNDSETPTVSSHGIDHKFSHELAMAPTTRHKHAERSQSQSKSFYLASSHSETISPVVSPDNVICDFDIPGVASNISSSCPSQSVHSVGHSRCTLEEKHTQD